MAARKLSPRIYAKTKASTEAGMHIVNLIMDKLRGHKTIQCYAIEEHVQSEFERQLWPSMMKWMEAVLESMKLGFVTEGLSYLITAMVIVGGAALVMGEDLTAGTLVAFMGYQGTLIGMIQTMTNVYGQFMSASSAFDQLFTVLDTQSTLRERPGAVMPAEVRGAFEFRGVTFAYDHQPVIHGLNLALPAGRTVALVGRSGSGKTTLANLLVRFYDPQQGAILLDGHDIRDLPPRAYRSLFGVVLQDPYLFDTTIRENLLYVRQNATEEELIDALRRAQAWSFVEGFAGGLDHRVGEGGGQLSGGQRQRLAIARCLLTRSRIVLLDEATSALDAESEMLVQQGLRSLAHDRTMVVIAHRLSTIRNADLVVVLEQGRLAEQGTFDDLLARGGLFAHLHRIATSSSTHRLKIEEAGFA
jgi:ABC-type multidrug transport system fused ATPase/permease subunit